jgi:hypothetical protein
MSGYTLGWSSGHLVKGDDYRWNKVNMVMSQLLAMMSDNIRFADDGVVCRGCWSSTGGRILDQWEAGHKCCLSRVGFGHLQ